MNPTSPGAALLVTILLLGASKQAAGQDSLPDAPSVQPVPAQTGPGGLNDATRDHDKAEDAVDSAASNMEWSPAAEPLGILTPCRSEACTVADKDLCCQPSEAPFQRFVRASATHYLTPHQKLLLAKRNALDPFNILTVLGTSAIDVASDPDSVYGPGLKGFAKNSAVAYTEGLTGEFFGTFLIPSLAHQDPHYHRMPNATVRRRIEHALCQVAWTESDSGQPMFNYATMVGTVATDAVNDLYVPGRKTTPGASAARIGTAIGTDPISNFITEFVPDLARRVKFNVVFLQRLVNQVAQEETRNASD